MVDNKKSRPASNGMRFKKYLVAFAMGILLLPAAASAQIVLTQAQQLQLAQLSSQLITIFNQIQQAASYGPSYTNSPTFQAQAAALSAQLQTIGAQLVALVSAATANTQTTQTYATQPISTGGTQCPIFSRTLSIGMSGADIAAMQLFLARDSYAAYSGAINGSYDYATMQAVQRYQAAYGIVSYGDPDTTGYGKVGPATQASMRARCAQSSYIITTPPIMVPVTPTPYPVNPGTVQTNYSTGQISITSRGQSGGPNSVLFSVNMLPNASCSSASFVLSFGDGQQQSISSNASCGNQIQSISHVYPNTGTYTATLSSGSFSTSVQVTIAVANNSLTLTAVPDPNLSFGAIITATYNPGNTCVPGVYTLSFGDNNTQSLNFGSGCNTSTQTINHTFPQAALYLVTASDSSGHTVTANVYTAVVTSAGTGDPFQVLLLHGDGSNGSTAITDSSQRNHSFTVGGSAHIDTARFRLGSAAINIPGGSSITTGSSDDFSYGSGDFTIDLWFNAASLPDSNSQAALMMQAGSSAADSTLGGAGLELFGNQVYFVGKIGSVIYHPFYNNSVHTSAIAANQWYHVAAVRSGGTITLYLNGISQGTITVSGSANASTGSLSLGRYGDYAGDYFNGWIDEVDIAKGKARWTANFDPGGGGAVGANDEIYDTSGTYTFTVPTFSSLSVEVWGGGGAGQRAGYYCSGAAQAGGQSSFNYAVVANGGSGGGSSCGYQAGAGGAGGSATGGDTNLSGNPGSSATGATPGIGGGTSYGAGGDGQANGAYLAGGGGGEGGYAKKTYSSGQLAAGTSVTVIVGAGGVSAAGGVSNGFPGRVEIKW